MRARLSLLCCSLPWLLWVAGCNSLPPGKPLAELTAQEAAGHTVYVEQCARCHNAYDTKALHGPSLFGMFRKPNLPSGAVARDERVTQVVLHGRGLMPAAGQELTAQQMQDLLRYLHTL